jgi:hypothetical protein
MIKPEQIPVEVTEKLREGLYRADGRLADYLATALNAWPGVCIRTRMQPDPENGGQWILPEKMLSLPLPKETE